MIERFIVLTRNRCFLSANQQITWKKPLARPTPSIRPPSERSSRPFPSLCLAQAAIGRLCLISPEFPTGKGKVDLCITCKEKKGIIEVKSFVDKATLENSLGQSATYASSLGLFQVTLAVFVPTNDKEILDKLSASRELNGMQVHVVAIGWG